LLVKLQILSFFSLKALFVFAWPRHQPCLLLWKFRRRGTPPANAQTLQKIAVFLQKMRKPLLPGFPESKYFVLPRMLGYGSPVEFENFKKLFELYFLIY